jgi:hypothetical protein
LQDAVAAWHDQKQEVAFGRFTVVISIWNARVAPPFKRKTAPLHMNSCSRARIGTGQ